MTYTITFRTNAHYTRPLPLPLNDKIELISCANNILGLRLIADWIVKPWNYVLHAPPCITVCTDLSVTDFTISLLRVLRIYWYSSNLFAQLCIIICGVFRVYLRVGYSWLIPVSHSLAARAHTFPIRPLSDTVPKLLPDRRAICLHLRK